MHKIFHNELRNDTQRYHCSSQFYINVTLTLLKCTGMVTGNKTSDTMFRCLFWSAQLIMSQLKFVWKTLFSTGSLVLFAQFISWNWIQNCAFNSQHTPTHNERQKKTASEIIYYGLLHSGFLQTPQMLHPFQATSSIKQNNLSNDDCLRSQVSFMLG